MPSITWMRAALSSSPRPLSGTCWRVVEAQHHVSTLKLVETLEEQRRFEALIERTKPPVPPECRTCIICSRLPSATAAFIQRDRDFGAPDRRKACSMPRRRRVRRSPRWHFTGCFSLRNCRTRLGPQTRLEHTAFAAEYRTRKAVDLTRAPYKAHAAACSHRTDYGACQAFAEAARAALIQIIRYRSVRDPREGMNVALLNCRAFVRAKPVALQTWRIHVRTTGAQAICEEPRAGIAFDRNAFASDPRIAALRWDR